MKKQSENNELCKVVITDTENEGIFNVTISCIDNTTVQDLTSYLTAALSQVFYDVLKRNDINAFALKDMMMSGLNNRLDIDNIIDTFVGNIEENE